MTGTPRFHNSRFLCPGGARLRTNWFVIIGACILLVCGLNQVTSQWLASFAQPYGICVDLQDNIYVSDDGQEQVVKIARNGTQLAVFNTNDPRLSYPQGLALDAKANLYVADQGNHRIVKFAPNGTILASFNDSILNYPKGVAIDPNNNIYVTDFGTRNQTGQQTGRIVKLNNTGQVLQVFTTPNLLMDHPNGIVLDPAGNLYVADYFNSRVVEFAPNGTQIQNLTTSKPTLSPNDLAWDANGNLYVSDDLNARVVKFVNGSQAGTIVTNKPSLNSPQGIGFDSKGYLYIADLFNYRVVKVNISLPPKNAVVELS